MEKQLQELIEKLRQPKMMLMVILILGVLLNGSLYLYQIMPQFLEKHNIIAQYNDLEKQRMRLEKIPIQKQITALEIEQLIQQVPISLNYARFLNSLKDIELKTNVEISDISTDQGNNENAASDLINSKGQTNIPANNKPIITPTPTTVNPNATPVPNVAPLNFTEESYSLLVQGTYEKLIDFMKQMEQLQRIVYIKEWHLTSLKLPTIQTDNVIGALNNAAEFTQQFNNNSDDLIGLTMKFSLFHAKQFDGKFDDLPPVPVLEQPEKRTNPMISDKQYRDILHSLKGE